jgi:hypothetical protein
MSRLKMLAELERRNFSQTTVCDLERYFKRPADELEPEQIRKYQAYLFRERKLTPNTVNQRNGCATFLLHHQSEEALDSGRYTVSAPGLPTSPRIQRRPHLLKHALTALSGKHRRIYARGKPIAVVVGYSVRFIWLPPQSRVCLASTTFSGWRQLFPWNERKQGAHTAPCPADADFARASRTTRTDRQSRGTSEASVVGRMLKNLLTAFSRRRTLRVRLPSDP